MLVVACVPRTALRGRMGLGHFPSFPLGTVHAALRPCRRDYRMECSSLSSSSAIYNLGNCLFPELLSKPELKRTLVSIDPDSNGAISTFTWQPSSNSTPRHQNLLEMLREADIVVHDMPTETWEMRSRQKKRPSATELVGLFRPLLDDADIVRVAVEFTTPTHLSGKFAWYDSGYASGTLDGVFQTMGVVYDRVPVASWKKDLGLIKLGKPGSLALAHEVFVDHKNKYLTRKKDHGRAESLLIGAWALGLRKDDSELLGLAGWPELDGSIDE
jgi:hypothetical protein